MILNRFRLLSVLIGLWVYEIETSYWLRCLNITSYWFFYKTSTVAHVKGFVAYKSDKSGNSKHYKVKVLVSSRFQLFATPWTVAH